MKGGEEAAVEAALQKRQNAGGRERRWGSGAGMEKATLRES